ncbi:universal stress protein [Siccirubricoccus sp. KC 17139]|uniref:Universal stress protein n=1 Tax=Siccirubricoccus soli TaxID=2899147 RepID=A0ABT1D9E4_9PROT|nr:universal stress protein [Siccirubricoccus soli]MCO6418550.1 universal stress protein [Siccirubricoccus soli]MCP2684685.1 universal stress protein [Siccirubricoccus soli]
MAYRRLLLPLTGTAAGEAALATALMVARIWNAHVHCLHVRVDARDVAPLAGEGLSGAMIEEMMAATERESGERAGRVRALFERFTEHAGGVALANSAETALKHDGPTLSFESIAGREEDVVAQQSRLYDMAVVPHPEAEEDVSSSDALHAVLFDSGRPVLIAPRHVPQTIGTRVCCAWNGSAESAAAVAAALPWLHRAQAVRLLYADEYQRRGPQVEGIRAYLRWHEIEAEPVMFKPQTKDVGAGLLGAARDFNADLLCMGAYSHSRLRQLILGGVTRHVLENSDMPVLMCR